MGFLMLAVNGGWTGFGDWGSCDKNCDGGVQSRRRTCSNPSPSFGGVPCEGAAEETRPCNQQPCAVNGSWTDFGAWGACNDSCVGGFQSRRRTCSNPFPSSNGASCVGAAEETRPCNQQPCIDENHVHATCRRSWEKVGCFRETVNVTTLWTDRGIDLTHKHKVDWKNYTPYLFELACRCKTLAEAKGFQYFGLRNYGDCTGIANLTGTVRYPDNKQYCLQEQFKNCNSSSESECMGKGFFEYVYKIGIDGGWTGFGDWGSCDKNCDGGVQSRRRTCSNPSPSFGGAPCEGAAEDTRSCNQQPCAVLGG